MVQPPAIVNACPDTNGHAPTCNPGTAYEAARCFCRPCYPGTYQPAAGQTTCLHVPAGTYSSGIGNTAFLPCPVNTYSVGSSGSCVLCPEGSYSNQTGSTTSSVCASTIFQGSISGLAYGPIPMPGLNFGAYSNGYGVKGLPTFIANTSMTLSTTQINMNIVLNNSLLVVARVQVSNPITLTLPNPAQVPSGSTLHLFARNGMFRNSQTPFGLLTPNVTAQVISNLPGTNRKSATQLVYEQGVLGADGVTPITSRRVSFPSNTLSFKALNAIGQRLLLATLNYTSGISTGGGQMLFINNGASLTAIENSNIAWMQSYGWTVLAKRFTLVTNADVVGKNLVVIAAGASSVLPSSIVNGTVPIVLLGPGAAIAINMATDQVLWTDTEAHDPAGWTLRNFNIGTQNTNGVTIFNGSHPLAAGLQTGQTYDITDPIVSFQGQILAALTLGGGTCQVQSLQVSSDGNMAGATLVSNGVNWVVQFNRNWVSADPLAPTCQFATQTTASAQPILTPVPLSTLTQKLKKIPDISQKTQTLTPVKHVIVVIQENNVFDGMFGTYPVAKNEPGEIPFVAKPGTSVPNGFTPQLLNNNPNGVNPQRAGTFENMQIWSSAAPVSNLYDSAWAAFNHGAMDRFALVETQPGFGGNASMTYLDGNVNTAYWNLAQMFGISDNNYHPNAMSSGPGYNNIVAGTTSTMMDINGNPIPTTVDPNFGMWSYQGAQMVNAKTTMELFDLTFNAPAFHHLSGQNIGTMLTNNNITWGFFASMYAPNATAIPGISSKGTISFSQNQPNPFARWISTVNLNHTQPSSPLKVGYTDECNHSYDLTAFWAALEAGNMPAVNYIRLDGVTHGHPVGSSSIPMEMTGFAAFMNRLQTYPQWNDTVVFMAFDDWGGFYDHVPPPLVMTSQCPWDQRDTRGSLLTTPGTLTNPPPTNGSAGTAPPILAGKQCRAGYGYRSPFMAFGPWVKENYIDHTLTDITSTLRFIEDNWLGSQRIGPESFDQLAGDLMGMFDFSQRNMRYLFLDETDGSVALQAHV